MPSPGTPIPGYEALALAEREPGRSIGLDEDEAEAEAEAEEGGPGRRGHKGLGEHPFPKGASPIRLGYQHRKTRETFSGIFCDRALDPHHSRCRGDCTADKFCKDVVDEKASIKACLEQHASELSEACKAKREAKAKKPAPAEKQPPTENKQP